MVTLTYPSRTTLVYPGQVWLVPDHEPSTPVTVRGAAERKYSLRRTNTWKWSHRRAPPAYRGLVGYSSGSTMIVTNTYYPPPGSAAQWP